MLRGLVEFGGEPYYKGVEKGEYPKATKDLDCYKQGKIEKGQDSLIFDETQFRLLINNEMLLNSDSGIQMIRFCNETENVKKYRQGLEQLLDKISQDVSF